jgi:hypothetical protein
MCIGFSLEEREEGKHQLWSNLMLRQKQKSSKWELSSPAYAAFIDDPSMASGKSATDPSNISCSLKPSSLPCCSAELVSSSKLRHLHTSLIAFVWSNFPVCFSSQSESPWNIDFFYSFVYPCTPHIASVK